jgi:hypothetical protein
VPEPTPAHEPTAESDDERDRPEKAQGPKAKDKPKDDKEPKSEKAQGPKDQLPVDAPPAPGPQLASPGDAIAAALVSTTEAAAGKVLQSGPGATVGGRSGRRLGRGLRRVRRRPLS